jgi:acyl carrier protein
VDEQFSDGFAEILEIEASSVVPHLDLTAHNWDSLAIVSTIALVDELYGIVLDGKSLANCKTVADIRNLVGGAKRSS